MLKNLCQLEYNVEGKVGRFTCENDVSLHFIKEMLFQFQKYIGHIEDQAKASQEAQKPEEVESVIEPIVELQTE